MNKTLIKSAILALALVACIVPAGKALASGDSYGTGDYYDSGYDDYATFYSPNYSSDDDYATFYSPNYSSGDDYATFYSPNYSGGGYSYSTPSYSSYSPSSGGGYSYTPSSSYKYVPSTGGSSAPQMQYVYSSNANKNTNTNTNTATANNTNTITNNPVNVFNPTNNNDARINLVVLGGGGNTTPTTQALEGNCVISPSTTYVGQNVSFTASATGGTGSYTYSWTGDNGLSASSQSFTGQFSYAGTKTATVTITSGGQSITRSCNVNVQASNVSVGGAYCVANPANAVVGQPVTWTVYPSSGTYYNNSYNYGYTYSWTGESLYNTNGQTVTATYSTPGYKTATVSVYGNGQTVSATCNVNIGQVAGSNVTVIRQPNTGTPVSGVFLSQVPATGISFGLKMTLFTLGILMWSAFAAYLMNEKRKKSLVTVTAGGSDMKARIDAFKLRNMEKKGITK